MVLDIYNRGNKRCWSFGRAQNVVLNRIFFVAGNLSPWSTRPEEATEDSRGLESSRFMQGQSICAILVPMPKRHTIPYSYLTSHASSQLLGFQVSAHTPECKDAANVRLCDMSVLQTSRDLQLKLSRMHRSLQRLWPVHGDNHPSSSLACSP